MKHVLVALGVAALALPVPAVGKGPSAASIDGPGTGGGISVSGKGFGATALGELTTQSGLYLQMFGEDLGKTLISRPTGDLGPKYTVTYTFPGPTNEVWKLRQDVYPYAEPAPATYLQPGQPFFDRDTHGGWYRAVPNMKQTLVAAGLPATPARASGFSEFRTALFSLLAAFLLVAMPTALLVRRRTRPESATA